MERERAAWRMVVTVLADQVEYLRYQATQAPHMSTALRELNLTGEAGPDPETGFKAYLSEEEEELLAANLAGRISDAQLQELAAELDVPVPSLEPDA